MSPTQSEEGEKQPLKLNTSGTTWQYGNITPVTSPVEELMPPPPLPTQDRRRLTAGSTAIDQQPRSKIQKIGAVSTTHLPNPPQGRQTHGLAASHPLLYAAQQSTQLLTTTVLGSAHYEALPEITPPFSPPQPVATIPPYVQHFSHGVVDPSLRTHMTGQGPPQWAASQFMGKADFNGTLGFVISPTFMIGLPCGGMIELAALYRENVIEIVDDEESVDH